MHIEDKRNKRSTKISGTQIPLKTVFYGEAGNSNIYSLWWKYNATNILDLNSGMDYGVHINFFKYTPVSAKVIVSELEEEE